VRAEHRRLSRRRPAISGAADQGEQAEMLVGARSVERLAAQHAMAGREVHRRRAGALPPQRRLQGQHIGRVADDLAAADRRDHPVLAHRPERRTDAKRRDRRQVDTGELAGEQPPQPALQLPDVARIAAREPHVPVLLPAAHQPGRGDRSRPAPAHVKQQRLQVGRAEPAFERAPRTFRDLPPHPLGRGLLP
jgi:hypothetical protein